MSYATCPNCGVTLAAPVSVEPPTTCPECCARLHRNGALVGPVPGPARIKDAVLLSATDAPRQARREFADFAALCGTDVVSTGELLVSEMVTNAVAHGPVGPAAEIDLRFAESNGLLHVEIGDGGVGFSAPQRRSGPEDTSGWGLQLVAALASDWGVDPGRPTRVWFDLAL